MASRIAWSPLVLWTVVSMAGRSSPQLWWLRGGGSVGLSREKAFGQMLAAGFLSV